MPENQPQTDDLLNKVQQIVKEPPRASRRLHAILGFIPQPGEPVGMRIAQARAKREAERAERKKRAARAYAKKHAIRYREQALARYYELRNDPEFMRQQALKAIRYAEKKPLARIAQKLVQYKVKKGEMRPASDFPCRDCGEPSTDYDHRDYNKPLEVEPVCRSCNLLRGPALPYTDIDLRT
jgi:formylmethanofuran dehydrogenase subunit E